MSETLDRHLRGQETPPMMDFIVKTLQSIQEEINFIAKTQSSDLVQRLAEARRFEEALTKCYGHIQALTRQLQIEAGLSMRNIITEQQAIGQNNQLEKINPAKLAAYDSSLAMEINRRACTENTRLGVISDIHAWLDDPNTPNVCWMNGMAGTGKTTIAYTFAQALERTHQLAASFFCTRTTAECRDVGRIVPTIAYQLARHLAPFRTVLCRILRDDPDILSRAMSTQFQQILKTPLLEVKDEIPMGLVVVIDALDECTASNGVNLTLDLLLREAPNLPLKFFVTSRPEPNIRRKIHDQPESSRSVYELHAVKQSDVQADIEVYIREELPSASLSQVKELAKRSGVLFIYAATAIRYILAGDLEDRLERMLSVGSVSKRGHAEIDDLYAAILSAALNNEVLEEDEAERMKLALRTAVCAREPISIQTLATLMEVDNPKKILRALEPLESVIYVSQDFSIVSPLHASFPDYMFDPTRSLSFWCNPEQHNGLLAQRCLKLMREQLRFNICGLESSYVSDDEVPGLEERVEQVISPTLAYICRYWVDHLQNAVASDGLHTLLVDFLSERLLFWMEVMNLKHWMGIGAQMILAAKLWTMAKFTDANLLKFVEDAQQFVTGFAANSVSLSTPHIYVSAVPLCYRSSMVYKCYGSEKDWIIATKGVGLETRSEAIIARWKVESVVTAVAYSPDGTQIVVGCGDGSIILKDAHNGARIGTLLEGHTSGVTSVQFSPDGAHIVSGSHDETIRIWNSRNGTLVDAPLEGHTRSVQSVAFSPNGSCIVSGSHDKTVRLWNAGTGAPDGAPLKGHTHWVNSVAFSPDGTRIVSGSYDNTIRIWDVHTHTGTPLEGHTSPVSSVAFSPDGTHIASGSYDETVRIWDARTGMSVGAPLKGHTHWVNTVAFSSDGAQIVSGSTDKTIRIWNAQNGAPVKAPFEGHARWVDSVSFSPDGTRVVSGSGDNTICIWNAQYVGASRVSLEGHTGTVRSAAFSPNGRLIASGSSDGVVRIWNAQDGAPIAVLLEDNPEFISSVAFSADSALVASSSGNCDIGVWNAQDGAPVALLHGHTGFIASVTFSPDSACILSGSYDMTIRIWDIQDGSLVCAPLEGHTDVITSVAFSGDGTRIASGSNDHTVRIWSVGQSASAVATLIGHTHHVTSVAFSPDGTYIASGSRDNSLRIWNTQDGSPIHVFVRDGVNTDVYTVAFSPDNTRVISGTYDRAVCIWNVQDGSPTGAPLRGHTDRVRSVGFSPDGTRIVSGSDDKTIRTWNIQNSTPSVEQYFVSEEGWVIGSHSRLFIWVPPDLRSYFPTPHNPLVIAPRGAISIDYSRALAGDSWLAHCPS